MRQRQEGQTTSGLYSETLFKTVRAGEKWREVERKEKYEDEGGIGKEGKKEENN